MVPGVELTNEDTSVTARLKARRLERHTTAMREMRLELEAVQGQTNGQIREAAEACQAQLHGDALALGEMMAPLKVESTLFNYELARLEEVWDDVDDRINQRGQSIFGMLATLDEIEDSRRQLVVQ